MQNVAVEKVAVQGDPALVRRVLNIFESKMQLSVDEPGTDLFETGILDSVGFVDLLLHLENEFGTKISLDELEVDNFRSAARIAEFIGSQAAR
jgi:D-alanine--poly(phosphoribitol) ligase subunit 2